MQGIARFPRQVGRCLLPLSETSQPIRRAIAMFVSVQWPPIGWGLSCSPRSTSQLPDRLPSAQIAECTTGMNGKAEGTGLGHSRATFSRRQITSGYHPPQDIQM